VPADSILLGDFTGPEYKARSSALLVVWPSVADTLEQIVTSLQLLSSTKIVQLLLVQPFEDYPDLLLSSELPAGATPDLSYCRFCRLLLRSCHFETLPGIPDTVKRLLA
jgi:hypothetical protein